MADILVVEDDGGTRLAIARALVEDGHSVVVARNSLEAEAIIRDRPMTLVIADMAARDQDGLETVTAIKRLSRETAVIAISSTGADESREELKYAWIFGADQSLPQPFTLERLRAAVRAWLDPDRALTGS
jgi:DNA-binding response OmpR family regulator